MRPSLVFLFWAMFRLHRYLSAAGFLVVVFFAVAFLAVDFLAVEVFFAAVVFFAVLALVAVLRPRAASSPWSGSPC